MDKGAVLISGASAGIGKATALLLDGLGYTVFAGVRSAEAGKDLQKESSSRLLPIILDITKPDCIYEAEQTVTQSLGTSGRLLGLINNAGIVIGGPIEFLAIDAFRQQMEVNVIGHIAVTQAFLPLLRKASGRIINVSSVAGHFALPYSGAYACSKFALEGLSDALRRELKSWRIPVILIRPGAVRTTIWDKSFIEGQRLAEQMTPQAKELYGAKLDAMEQVMRRGQKNGIEVERVAQVIRKALEAPRPKTRYPIGPDAFLAELSLLLPDWIKDWLIVKVMEKKLPSWLMGW